MGDAIRSPDASLPTGPWPQAVRAGERLLVPGQGPVDPQGR